MLSCADRSSEGKPVVTPVFYILQTTTIFVATLAERRVKII